MIHRIWKRDIKGNALAILQEDAVEKLLSNDPTLFNTSHQTLSVNSARCLASRSYSPASYLSSSI
jgi:hypothetical protein